MLCPVCRHDNLQGEDNCENCGADLRTADIPEQAVSFMAACWASISTIWA